MDSEERVGDAHSLVHRNSKPRYSPVYVGTSPKAPLHITDPMKLPGGFTGAANLGSRRIGLPRDRQQEVIWRRRPPRELHLFPEQIEETYDVVFKAAFGIRAEKESECHQEFDQLVALGEIGMDKGGLDEFHCEHAAFGCEACQCVSGQFLYPVVGELLP